MESGEKSSVVTLKEAADQLGITDLETVRRVAKSGKCLIRATGGIFYVDLDALQIYLEGQVQKQAEKMKAQRENPGEHDQLGILMARAKMYPAWIEAKRTAADAVTAEVTAATNPYARRKAQKELIRLQADLERMLENQRKDETALERIIADPITPEVTGDNAE